MHGDTTSSVLQGASLEIYRDSLAPQPGRRVKAFERAPVEAHAPRLQGQKIWKKAGIKTTTNDKENFEATWNELENGGVDSRKKRRIMGAKKNIGEAKWLLDQEDFAVDAQSMPSPMKNGRLSTAFDNPNSLLVPRKRTNADHMVTPRKSSRKLSNNNPQKNELSNPTEKPIASVPGAVGAYDVEGEKLTVSPLKPKSINQKGAALFNASENSERRRSSLRKSNRRLTYYDSKEPIVTESLRKSRLSLPAHSTQSLPAFLVPGAASDFEIVIPSFNHSNDHSDDISKDERNLVASSTNHNSSRSFPGVPDSLRIQVDSVENAETVKLLEATISMNAAVEETPSMEEGSSSTVNVNKTIKSPAVGPTTPPQLSNINSTHVNPMQLSTPDVAPHPSIPQLNMDPMEIEYKDIPALHATPKSSRKISRQGSRRSTRTPGRSSALATKVFAPSAQDFIEVGASTSSPSKALRLPESNIQPLDKLSPPEAIAASPIEGTSTQISTEAAILSESADEDATSTGPVASLLQNESVQDQVSDPLNLPQVQAAIDDMDAEVEFDIGTPFDTPSLLHDAQQTTSPHNMDHIVNLFPAAQNEPETETDSSLSSISLDEEYAGSTEDLTQAIPIVNDLVNVIPAIQDSETTPPDIEEERGRSETTDASSRPLVDHDDTDLLRDFVTRVKASKAAKAATGIPKRKRSLPHSPIRVPLESETSSPPAGLEDKHDDFGVSLPAESPNKRRKQNEETLDEDELSQPRTTRRSVRTRLPVKTPIAAPSFIPVRRLNQDGDNTISLKKNEDKELAALTRLNTRKNKGGAILPLKLLAKKAEEKDDPASRQRALKEVFDEKLSKKKEGKKGKIVVWAKELTQFQTEDGKKAANDKEVEKEPVVEAKPAVKVGMRSKMSLGMAANGTPAAKKTTKRLRGRA